MLSYCYLKHLKRSLEGIAALQVRFKSKRKDHWADLRKLNKPTDKALEHFDEFYKTVFGTSWPSVRLGLLSQQKYCAVVNFFGDNEENIKKLQAMGCMDVQAEFHEQSKKWRTRRSAVRPEFDQAVAGMDKQISDTPETEPEIDLSNRVILPSEAEGGVNETVLHDFVPATKLKGMEDWIQESDQLKYYDVNGDFVIPTLENGPLEFPKHLHVFAFGRGDVTRFPPPKAGATGNLGYYLMDAGSILPILALNLQPGDHVLDLCAAPGGKSLAMLQTLLPERLVCNDTSESRVKRIHQVFQQYMGSSKALKDTVTVCVSNGVLWDKKNEFDKGTFMGRVMVGLLQGYEVAFVLVDAPCTSDRHSLTEDDNNIFKPTRMKERINLPELQAALLKSALQAVKPGGTVVYSTCSLSPIQNDGVVHMALKQAAGDFGIVGGIRSLEKAFKPLQFLYQFARPGTLRYGQLVLPFLPSNYGPTYICKIERIR